MSNEVKMFKPIMFKKAKTLEIEFEKKIKKNFEFEVKSPKLDTILRFNKVNGKRQGIAIEFNKKTYYYSEFIYENNIKQGDIKI